MGEVVFAVAATEVVSSQFEAGVVGIETAFGSAEVSLHVIYDGRFDAQCPCFLFAQIEVQVQSQACRPWVCVTGAVLIVMQPADARHCFDFEDTWLACVSSKKIH